MTTTIDRAGRLVVPKAIRDQAGWQPGDQLDIRISYGVVEILPPQPKGRLVEKDGHLVWRSDSDRMITGEEVDNAIRAAREERENEVLREAFGLEDRS
jgi:AbrB family looped-hinge helix DNA binding protein